MGARDFSLNGAAGQRVCVYLERTFTGTGARGSFVEGSKLLVEEIPPPAPPAPSPSPALTEGAAKREAKSALKKKFGKKFKTGKSKKLRCVEDTSTRFDCRVKWIYADDKYRGHVVVTSGPTGTTTKVKVKRL